jgi:glycine/D-amino acid oxidase-like deaminating enzyme
MKRFPAMVIPDYLEGVLAPEAGVIKVKEALQSARDLSIKQGADLRYDANVVAVNHDTCTVTMESGEKYTAKNIVVTCGATTD